MPVKTRKPTRRSKREPHRSRHSARSSSLRSLGITDSTTGENSTISSLKRGIAAAHSSPSLTISLLSSQRRNQPTILRSSSHPSKAKVTVTTDAWYDLLAKNPDLCYLSLSGQFNRKNGCILKNVNGSYSIEHFFADLYSQQSYSPQGQVINRAFNKLIEDNGLPKVVFHSLRHSSITYKLKLNGGDMKSVQGDSGHAQVKMVADVYSHIIDDDRRVNAERMEAAFYSGRQVSPEPKIEVATGSQDDNTELLLKLLQNPEMATLLKTLAKSL